MAVTLWVGLLADANGDGHGHMGGWGGAWMWLWGGSMMVLSVLLIVWLVRATVARPSDGASGLQNPNDRAREILAERYAKGELSTEEYTERASHLE